MPVPAFGFSAGDFISAVTLINTVRKALKDSGGSQDEIRAVLQDLQQLHVVLIQIHEGDWGMGGDVSHVNAVRGLALTCQEPLQRLLQRLEIAKDKMAQGKDGVKGLLLSSVKRGEWALFLKEDVDHFRQVIMAKLIVINFLTQLPTGSRIAAFGNDTKELTKLFLSAEKDIKMQFQTLQKNEMQLRQDFENLSSQIRAKRDSDLPKSNTSPIEVSSNSHPTQHLTTKHLLLFALGSIGPSVLLIAGSMMLDTVEFSVRSKSLTPAAETVAATVQYIPVTSEPQTGDISVWLFRLILTGLALYAVRYIKLNTSDKPYVSSMMQREAKFWLGNPVEVLDRPQQRVIGGLQRPSVLDGDLDAEVNTKLQTSTTQKKIPQGPIRLMTANLVRLLKAFSIKAFHELEKLLGVNLQIYALFRRLQNKLYFPLTSAMDDCFRFEDAFGRSLYLNYQNFRHWDVFATLLKCEFEGTLGENLVQQNQYRILDSRIRGHAIDASTWSNEVYPGSQIKMSMVLAEASFESGRCPRDWCGKENTKICYRDTRYKRCDSCGLEYYQTLNEDPPSTTALTQTEGSKAETFQSLPQANVKDMDAKRGFIAAALRVFRTVHIRALERTITQPMDLCAPEDQTPDFVETVGTQALEEKETQILPTDRWNNWVSF